MKKILFSACTVFSLLAAHAQTGRVDAATGQFTFTGNLADNYMFYGYAEPDSRSKKMILFSAYPLNISDNVLYQYPLGAYHETSGLKDGHRIEYIGHKNGYAEMRYLNADHEETIFYIKEGYVKKP